MAVNMTIDFEELIHRTVEGTIKNIRTIEGGEYDIPKFEMSIIEPDGTKLYGDVPPYLLWRHSIESMIGHKLTLNAHVAKPTRGTNLTPYYYPGEAHIIAEVQEDLKLKQIEGFKNTEELLLEGVVDFVNDYKDPRTDITLKMMTLATDDGAAYPAMQLS